MEERNEGDLLGNRVNMHDGVVAGADDRLGLENRQLCLEPGRRVDRTTGRGEDVSWRDVDIGDARETDADVVARIGVLELLVDFVVDVGNLDGGLGGNSAISPRISVLYMNLLAICQRTLFGISRSVSSR